MASPGTMKKLLNELQTLKKECQEYRQRARNQTNFNRKLCSQNRRRRLTNNQLKRQEQDRLIQLQLARGSTQELKKLIVQLQKSLEEKEKQMMDWQDEVLILKTQITKQNQIVDQLQNNYKILERRYVEKCRQYDTLFKTTYKQAKTSKITPKGGDFDEQLMGLINENCELQKKIKEMKQIFSGYQEKIERTQMQIKEMVGEIESKEEIISILIRQNDKGPIKQETKKKPGLNQQNSISTFLTQMAKIFSQRNKVKSLQNNAQNIEKTPIYELLRVKVQEYCKDYLHLLYSNDNIQNLSQQAVTVNYCQVIHTKVEGIWKSRIRIATEGELYFGLADARFNYIEVMRPIRNFIYYNNCTGAVVINKEGKIIEEYAHKGDNLQIQISLKKDKKMIKFYKNNKEFCSTAYPQCFKNSEKLFIFIKLFKNMAVDLF